MATFGSQMSNSESPTLSSGVVPTSQLGTGTPNGTKYLRDDGTWVTPPSGGGPHATDHQNGGTDEISVAGLSGLLADAQTPLTHSHPQSEVTNLVTDLAGKAASSHTHNASDVNAGTISTARLGSGTADATTYLRGDQTWATPSGGGGGPSVVKSTGDQTATTATLINVTNCSFSVTSGVYYKFQFLVPFRSTLATVGLRLALTFPAVTVFACTGQIPIAGAGAGGVLQGYIIASGGAVVGTAVPAVNQNYLAILDGFILPSANGTLQLQFAAETTGATVTCKQGACGFLYTL